MKKLLLLTLGAVLTMSAAAAPRSLRQAQQSVPGTHALQHCHTAIQPDGTPAFYVFNRGENEGFVIVSSDDRARTILGYTDTGRWDENDMPTNMRAWLDNYVAVLRNIDASYSSNEAETTEYTPVAPLTQTLWNQKTPYNDSCPLYQGVHTAAGCVAIAGAQIMKYHLYPAHGIGSKTYKWANENGDSIELSANYAGTTYHWTDMMDSCNDKTTEAQKSAVAQLVYQCGVACEMKYGKSSSSGSSSLMNQCFIDYFGYDKGIRMFAKDYTGEARIMEVINENLQAGQPVYISAKTTEGNGHAFICDGIDTEGLLHINWGWGGKSNGYFQLSALAPQNQGTGGSSTNKAYTERVQVYTDIKPNAGGNYVYSLACEKIRFDAQVVERDSAVRIHVDTLRNFGFCPWTGHLKLYIYKNGEYYTYRTINEDMNPLANGKYRKHVSYNAKFQSYANGEYEVVIAARASDQPNAYIPIYNKGIGEYRFRLVITTDSIYVNCAPGEPAQAIENRQTDSQPAQKILQNGQIYILRHGRKYTMEGCEWRD